MSDVQKIDVLAVMDAVAVDYAHLLPECAATVRAARTTVAELIKQRDDAIALLQAHAEALLYEPDKGSLDARIDAFLARICGEQA